MLRHAPGVPIVDLTHGVDALRRASAARWRWCAPCRISVPVSSWPSSTPAWARRGAPSRRCGRSDRPAADATAGGPHHFVGPDNGLLPWAVDVLGGVERAVEIAAVADARRGAARCDLRRSRRLRPGGGPAVAGDAARRTSDDPIDPADLVRLTPARLLGGPGLARGRGAVGGPVRQRPAGGRGPMTPPRPGSAPELEVRGATTSIGRRRCTPFADARARRRWA